MTQFVLIDSELWPRIYVICQLLHNVKLTFELNFDMKLTFKVTLLVSMPNNIINSIIFVNNHKS